MTTYWVVVLRDLLPGTDPHLEAAALSMVSLHLGLVVQSTDLLAACAQRVHHLTTG